MSQFDNAMRRHVLSLPELLEQQYKDLEPKTRAIFTTPEIFSMQRIVLTGCGDSYAAGLATKHTFERLTGLPTEVVTAIDLARHYDEKQLGFAPHNPVVIAVSNSGRVVRVAEAMQRAVKHGSLALGITGKPDSLMGQSASKVLQLEVPPFESAPGTRSYLVAVLALLLLAIRIGEVRGRYTMDEAMAYRKEIPKLAARLGDALPQMDADMLALAEKWKDLEAFDFIGSGQDYAAAWFGHAKVFEGMGWYAMHINTEEWLHMNFFMRRFDKLATVLVYGGGSPAKGRTAELLSYIKQMGRPTLVVTDAPDELPVEGVDCVKLPDPGYAMLLPLVQFVPLCLLVGYIGEMIGEKDGRGCEGPWSFAQGAAAIHQSEIEVL